MGRNLLLGNGINMHLGVSNMGMNDIAIRFTQCLIRSSPIYELLFGINFNDDICIKLFPDIAKCNIELLADKLYDLVIHNTNKSLSDNLKMQLIDAIICTAITAIFYNEQEKLGNYYNKESVPNMALFDNIYTLNYAEFWDDSSKCTFLHGKYNMNSIICDDKPVLHYSCERYLGYEGYKELIEEMKKDYNMCELYTRNIVFSPAFFEKVEIINLGLYPSSSLYPAEDYFLREVISLYKELDGIDEIEVFGMSPYGDDNLINILNKMKNVVVYIHNRYDKDNNKQADIWESLLKGPHSLLDSKEIMDIK